MPDGTYRQFDASEEIADAWKRLTNGKATDEDLLLFNHELTELRFVEEGFSVDAAHILSSVDYNWSSVSKIDDFAQKCSEIYGKDFYFGAGTSNEAIDAIVKQIDNLDGQVDDLIEGGVNSYNDFSKAVKSIGTRTDLTDSQKVDMLQKLFEKSSYKTDINVPSDIKYVKRIDGDGIDYNWPPKLGFDESTVKPISKTDGLPDVWDRYGYMGGSNFSDVPSTGKYTYSERALPYIENEAAYHVGSGFNDVSYFDKIDAIRNGDIDALNNILESEGLKKVTDEAFGRYVKQYCDYENKVAKAFGGTMYNAPYGISGHAARWKDLSGGAPQYTFPLSGESMVRLGIMS